MLTKHILVIDNYDSFTYNLVHLLKEIGESVDVKRNNKFSLTEIEQYEKILLSPGPGIPSEAGLMLDTIKKYAHEKSILGVCLGHQGIGEVFGCKLVNMEKVCHGISTSLKIVKQEERLFRGIPNGINVGLYHSWAVEMSNNVDIEITSMSSDSVIMSIAHKYFDVKGVQFHPESILTNQNGSGKQIIKNWLNRP